MNEINLEHTNSALSNEAIIDATVYGRTSTTSQAEDTKISIPDQIQWAENLCKEKGWNFVGSYIDTLPGDIEFDQRPQGFRLLEDAKLKRFNLVLLYHSSRLAREPWVGLKTLAFLGRNGVQTFIRNAPIEPVSPKNYIYGSNIAGEYLNALSLTGDKAENVARGERVTSGFKNLAQRGIMVFAPYAYRKIPKIDITSDGRQIYSWSFIIDPSKSTIVRRIYNQYNSGKSLRKIVKELIIDKIPSPSGKTGLGSWSPATIRNTLSNPVYAGKTRWGRKLGSKYRQGRNETGKQKRVYASADKWLINNSINSVGIIDTPLFEKTQVLLKQRGKIAGRQLSSDSLLPGLVYCGDCQRRAFIKTRKIHKNGNIYVRSDFIDQSYVRGLDCRRHLMAAEKLEQLVLLQLQSRLKQLNELDIEKQLLSKNNSSKLAINESVNQIAKQLKTFEVKKTRLLDAYLNGTLTRNAFANKKEELDNEETLLIQEQNRLIGIVNDEQKNISALQTLKQLLNMFNLTTDLKLRKEMLHRFIETIVIYKDHVEIVYKYSTIGTNRLNDKPYPCGYFGDNTHDCKCAPSQILRYQKRVSGPMLDRIDIHLDVPAVKVEKFQPEANQPKAETSKVVRLRVQKARDIQTRRFTTSKISANAEMNNKDIKKYCALSNECLNLLKLAVSKMQLSARSYQRVIKLSRTIADLESSKEIKPNHIAESLQYRPRIDNLY